MARRRDTSGFRERIKKLVASRVAEAIQANPEALEKLKELGVVDDDWLTDPTADPGGPLLRLRALTREVSEHPSLLGDVKAIELLGAQPGARALAASETRDRLTVVFTDLEGFTSFTEEEGDATAGRILRSHYSVVDEIVEGRGGRVVKRLGDGHMATFTTPRAAVMASLELVQTAPDALRLRAGGHLGDVTALGEDVIGATVNLASRVAASAEGGHTRMTVPVRDGAGALPGVRFEEPFAAQFRGIDEAVEVCEVVSA